MNIENEYTFKKALGEGINLFLGAGFSILAKDSKGNSLPVGDMLSKELVAHFGMEGLESLPLPQLCTIIEAEQQGELRNYFQNRFAVKDFDARYNNLHKLNVKTIFTTNIDDLIYKIYANSSSSYINDIVSKGSAFGDRTAVDYIPLHGSIAHPNEKLVFSTTDLAGAFASDTDKWNMLTGRLQSHPTLFFGYGMADSGVLQSISTSAANSRPHREKWVCLRTASDANKRYFKALGFNIIEGETKEILDYFSAIQSAAVIPKQGVTTATQELFPEYTIPAVGTVPVRSIREFYLGAAPSWFDIYSGVICKTSHYAEIIESINSGKHTVFVGIPACGKTTLMMQAAAAYEFDGHKIVCDALTLEKAHLILKNLGHDRALIFLDNCSDSIDALNLFINQRNIVVMAFDRDYDFESGSHKLTNLVVKKGLTNLIAQDQQSVYQSIPKDLRRDHMQLPKLEKGVSLSLFELLEENLLVPKLKKRYLAILKQLSISQQILHDYLVMCSYVHSCHTPVSFDMSYAFLRNDISGYTDAYKVIHTLQSLIPDYVGDLANDVQDYYMPRSSYISESIMDLVSGNALQRVLIRFHNNVSPGRICHFDIFKRRAFSSDIAKKAFPKWFEGKDYFDYLYERDKSPYLLQQAALYFLAKSRFTEAFAYIDRALVQAGPRVFSIRNSHAIILFEANIRYASHGDVKTRDTLDQSMIILTECYQNDKRKQYHAVKFGQLAIQYWNVFGDEKARSYLSTAKNWLKEENAHSPWNRGISQTLYNVTRTS